MYVCVWSRGICSGNGRVYLEGKNRNLLAKLFSVELVSFIWVYLVYKLKFQIGKAMVSHACEGSSISVYLWQDFYFFLKNQSQRDGLMSIPSS